MATRRDAREWAVQVLLALEMNPQPQEPRARDAFFDAAMQLLLRAEIEMEEAAQSAQEGSIAELRQISSLLADRTASLAVAVPATDAIRRLELLLSELMEAAMLPPAAVERVHEWRQGLSRDLNHLRELSATFSVWLSDGQPERELVCPSNKMLHQLTQLQSALDQVRLQGIGSFAVSACSELTGPRLESGTLSEVLHETCSLAFFEELLVDFRSLHDRLAGVREGLGEALVYARELVEGVMDRQDQINALLAEHLRNWSVERLGVVERCVLRVGAFELLLRPDVPGAVIINEAVDITKYFGAERSGSFVNGVLDKCYRALRGGEG